MLLQNGHIYLAEDHIALLKGEPEYVKRRYHAVACTLAHRPFRITRKDAADLIAVCRRHMIRIVNRFREEGIGGLRFRSKTPKTSPNRTPADIEHKIIAVRDVTGLGPEPISAIVNESLKREGRSTRVYSSLCDKILVRHGLIEREKRLQKEYRRFEWGHPNRLIQADITKFNGVPILTLEDDHSRKGWSIPLRDQRDVTVIAGMKALIKIKYDNLLTDNGSQFSRVNSVMRKYCEQYLNEKHIWTSIHHPQTMGKLSAYQKWLKHFLRHRLKGSRNRQKIAKEIRIYNQYYNNGRFHSVIQTYPEMRYSGELDPDWFESFVKSLKLEKVLCVAKARG